MSQNTSALTQLSRSATVISAGFGSSESVSDGSPALLAGHRSKLRALGARGEAHSFTAPVVKALPADSSPAPHSLLRHDVPVEQTFPSGSSYLDRVSSPANFPAAASSGPAIPRPKMLRVRRSDVVDHLKFSGNKTSGSQQPPLGTLAGEQPRLPDTSPVAAATAEVPTKIKCSGCAKPSCSRVKNSSLEQVTSDGSIHHRVDAAHKPGGVQPSARQSVDAGRRVIPSWEVTDFAWPEISSLLLSDCGAWLDSIIAQLYQSSSASSNRLAIGSVRRYSGATSVAIAIARRLSNMGCRTLLVDADIGHPGLSTALGISMNYTWCHVGLQANQIAQSLVTSTRSGMTVMMAGMPKRELGKTAVYDLLKSILKIVVPDYHAIVIDAGPVAQLAINSQHTSKMFDAAALVYQPSITSHDDVDQASRLVAMLGAERLALVANRAHKLMYPRTTTIGHEIAGQAVACS